MKWAGLVNKRLKLITPGNLFNKVWNFSIHLRFSWSEFGICKPKVAWVASYLLFLVTCLSPFPLCSLTYFSYFFSPSSPTTHPHPLPSLFCCFPFLVTRGCYCKDDKGKFFSLLQLVLSVSCKLLFPRLPCWVGFLKTIVSYHQVESTEGKCSLRVIPVF